MSYKGKLLRGEKWANLMSEEQIKANPSILEEVTLFRNLKDKKEVIDYSKMNKKDLISTAKEKGIVLNSNETKDELILLLKPEDN